jgi:putative DNA primase/helicase
MTTHMDVARPHALQELKPGQQWVCFDKNKTPYDPASGSTVKGELIAGNPTWGTYQQARSVWKSNPEKYAGIGREFLREQGITGVDLDHCIDEQGQIAEWALAEVKRFNSYTEKSPSGHGLHIWVRGIIPSNIGPCAPKSDGYEMYDHSRYFTFTGNHLEGTPTAIEDRQAQMLDLHQEITTRRAQAKRQADAQKQPTTRRATPHQSGDTPYGLAALENECRDMRQTSKDSHARNTQLNRSAFALGQLVAGGELTRSTAETDLYAAAASAGLDDREIEKTMRSGIEKGMDSPRSAPVAPIASSDGHKGPPRPPTPTTDDFLCEFRFGADDAGNGDALNELYGDEFLFCKARGWFVYTGTHWELYDSASAVKRRAVETLRRRRHAAVDADNDKIIASTKADERRVNGCVSRLTTLVEVKIDAFDSDPDQVNCLNGVVDLRTGRLAPHSREQRFTYCLPVAYERADMSEWVDYLNGVVGGGQEVIDYLQMALGYSLTGHTREEILFYLYGPTRSGKGTFSETITSLLPRPLSAMVDFNSFTAKREGDVSNFDLAPLKPARLIFASESNRSQSLNPSKIKQLTGGDHIMCCFKHRDHFTYRPQFKIWMMSNWPVNGDPEDDALWGRVRVIEFPNSFLGIEDKGKKARLKEPDVLKGVLYWLVQGAMKWYALGAAGLSIPASIAATTKGHRAELDYVQQWLDECCDDDEEGWVSNKEVMKSYTTWCEENNVQHTKGPKGLAQSLKLKGFEVGKQKFIEGENRRGVAGLHVYS